ncbi:hypothetical protein Fmac_005931 [Flemingia macrophylla]|uniref:Uncharacterized protein n=1 Tax=Flemingia macrophylla TaxID=520843 RepID=A0ABD1N962_9FABA
MAYEDDPCVFPFLLCIRVSSLLSDSLTISPHQRPTTSPTISRRTCHDHSQTPIYDNDVAWSKSQKGLIKKSNIEKQAVVPDLEDEDEEEGYVSVSVEEVEGRKRKKGKEGGSGKKEKRMKAEKRFGSGAGKGGSKKGFGEKERQR